MMVYISMKFHENILNGLQVKERTRNDLCQIAIFPSNFLEVEGIKRGIKRA